MQKHTVAGAATTQGHAPRIGEERKMATRIADCQVTGVNFEPMVVETLGGWSEEAVHTIKRIGRLLGKALAPPLQKLHIIYFKDYPYPFVRQMQIRG